MPLAFFVSDLHGSSLRYEALLEAVAEKRPAAVFLGGDLFPHPMNLGQDVVDFEQFNLSWRHLRDELRPYYPAIFLVLGNDDPHILLEGIESGEADGLWRYSHRKTIAWDSYFVMGYNCVPPTPFLLKDWERYDVSRFVDPGCLPPDEGWRTDDLTGREIRHTTIRGELAEAAAETDLGRTICLFHCPPYGSDLDRAALDGKMVDHAPLDVHVGSIAIRDFITERHPLLTLHGHVHESVRLTGRWRQRFGPTHSFGAAHDGPELALVCFDPDDPGSATRILV